MFGFHVGFQRSRHRSGHCFASHQPGDGPDGPMTSDTEGSQTNWRRRTITYAIGSRPWRRKTSTSTTKMSIIKDNHHNHHHDDQDSDETLTLIISKVPHICGPPTDANLILRPKELLQVLGGSYKILAMGWKIVFLDAKKNIQPMHPSSTFKGVPNGSWRVSIHHPLGFNWHPFEGPGVYSFVMFNINAQYMASQPTPPPSRIPPKKNTELLRAYWPARHYIDVHP